MASARPLPKTLLNKLGALPRHRVAEVEDFVDFIGDREARQIEAAGISGSALAGSAKVLAAIWDNPDDDIYNEA